MKTIAKIMVLLCFLGVGIIPCNAGCKWESGDVGQFFGIGKVPVFLNYSNAVFAGYGNMSDFLLMADRDKDWEPKNIKDFCHDANEEFQKEGYGFRFSPPKEAGESLYALIIEIKEIKRNGHILGVILLIDSDTKEPLVKYSFISDDAEPDDDDVFEDQLESIGESLGKQLRKGIKKTLK